MKKILAVAALLACLILIPAAQAAPNPLTGLPLPQSLTVPLVGSSHDGHPIDTITVSGTTKLTTEHPILILKADPTGACPGSAVHCIIATWSASSDGAANPTLAYNFYVWPVGGTAPTCTNGNPCTGATPANSTPTAAGCAAACGFTDTAVGPGKFNIAVTAVLNGSESILSNVVAITIAPATPVLSGTGN